MTGRYTDKNCAIRLSSDPSSADAVTRRLASQREDSPEGTGTFGREKGDIQIYVVRRERIEGVDRSVAKLGDYESAELVQVRMFH
jgi:hypothetical protein